MSCFFPSFSVEKHCSIGYDSLLFSRPHLHRLLLSKVPPEKIKYGKKVLSVGQSEYGVLLRCSDKSVHEGDILVGADGAYSAVRQSMYERLLKEKKLPKIDTQSLNVGYTCMVGTTTPQDPEVYNVLKDDFSHFAVVIADGKPHSVCQAEPYFGNRVFSTERGIFFGIVDQDLTGLSLLICLLLMALVDHHHRAWKPYRLGSCYSVIARREGCRLPQLRVGSRVTWRDHYSGRASQDPIWWHLG